VGKRGGERLMVDVCECAANWRVELTNMLTGAIEHMIVPISFEFETAFLEAGRGTITFNRRGTSDSLDEGYVSANDVFPGATGIFFQRIAGGAATPHAPVNMFGGFIETVQGNSDGTVTLGFAEMQKYLDYRLIRSDLVFTGVNQNAIAQNLVNYARGTNALGGSTDPAPSLGIPLVGGNGVTAFNRDRTYLAVDRPVIGDMIKQLIGVEDGPVYELIHTRETTPIVGLTDNWWSEMFFLDELVQPSPAKFISWHHVTDLLLNLDGNGIANQIDAFGDPEEDGTPRISTANSPTAFLPRFDAAPAFSGVTNLITLGQHASGYQLDHMDPSLNLQLNFTGLDYGTAAGDPTLSLDDLVPGRNVNIDIESPNWTIKGGPDMPAEGTHIPSIGRVSVSVGQEGPEQVTAQIIVDSYPGNMLSAQPIDCVDC
jgi:hypothetical protein